MIGARVGNWYVEAEIGRGALGTVYAARGFEEPDRRAAVKVFTDPLARNPAFLKSFSGEMLALQRLDHPNIAKYYDSGIHGGLAYVATELVRGTDAARLLEDGKRPWQEVLAIAVQIGRALKHGHNRNVLHRDLKPAHIIIGPDGTVKLLGFGLARVIAATLGPSSVMGSPAYMPPESFGGKPPTRRSDFYSLGGALYTLLTGRPPFTAATLVELMHKQCYTLPERPGMLVPDVPPELDEFVCGLLAKDPARRPTNAQALLDDLERVRGKLERKGERLDWPAKLKPDTAEMAALPASLGGLAPDPDEVEATPRPWLRRPMVVIPLFAAVVIVAITLLAWPGPSADNLWRAAEPLVESDDPANWDRAWEEYLDPLSRKFPDQHAAEVSAAKARIRDRKELRRAVSEGAKVEHRTDAERGYVRGLRLAQAGELVAARAAWHAVVAAFAAVESESRWVGLARAGLAALDAPPTRNQHSPTDRKPFEAAIAFAKGLATAGKTTEAEPIFRALEELARDDPAATELLRAARAK
jgi:hypothetical protein